MLPRLPRPSSHTLPASLSPTPASLSPKVEKHSRLLAAQCTLTQKPPRLAHGQERGQPPPQKQSGANY